MSENKKICCPECGSTWVKKVSKNMDVTDKTHYVCVKCMMDGIPVVWEE